MSYDEDVIERVLSSLRGQKKAAIHGARQMAVESITNFLSVIDKHMDLLHMSRTGLMKAREVCRVADIKELEQTLEAVKVIIKTLSD